MKIRIMKFKNKYYVEVENAGSVQRMTQNAVRKGVVYAKEVEFNTQDEARTAVADYMDSLPKVVEELDFDQYPKYPSKKELEI